MLEDNRALGAQRLTMGRLLSLLSLTMSYLFSTLLTQTYIQYSMGDL